MMRSNQRRRICARSFGNVFAQGLKARCAASIAPIVSASPKRGVLARTAPVAGLAIGRVPSPTHFPSTRHLSLSSVGSASFMGRASRVGGVIGEEGGPSLDRVNGRHLCGKTRRSCRPRCRNRPLPNVYLLPALSENGPTRLGREGEPMTKDLWYLALHGNADGGALDSVHRLPGDDERPLSPRKLRRPQAASGPIMGSARSSRLSQRNRMFRAIRRAGDCRANRRKSRRNDRLLGDELFLAEARARRRLLGRPSPT